MRKTDFHMLIGYRGYDDSMVDAIQASKRSEFNIHVVESAARNLRNNPT